MGWLARLLGLGSKKSNTVTEEDVPPPPIFSPRPVSAASDTNDFAPGETRQKAHTTWGNAPTRTHRGPRLSDGFSITLRIGYVGIVGETTERVVDVKYLDGTLHKDGTITLIGFGGYCHLREDDRDFIFQGLEWAAVPDTGEIIPNFPSWFARKVGRTEPVRGIKAIY